MRASHYRIKEIKTNLKNLHKRVDHDKMKKMISKMNNYIKRLKNIIDLKAKVNNKILRIKNLESRIL